MTENPRIRIDWDDEVIWLNCDRYPIAFNQLTSTGEVLDFIFQIASKGWASHALVGELVEVLELVAQTTCQNNAQGIWCPGGRHMETDLENGTFKPIKISLTPKSQKAKTSPL